MKGSIQNPRDSHPQCTECGRTFPSMGKFIAHYPHDDEENDAATS